MEARHLGLYHKLALIFSAWPMHAIPEKSKVQGRSIHAHFFSNTYYCLVFLRLLK